MLDYDAVKNWDFGEIRHSYTARDAMLYALGVGFGSDPLDRGQLHFAQEKYQQAVPTMTSVIGSPGHWWRNPATGVDWVKVLHGEQDTVFFKPLPVEATLVARHRVLALTDKGVGRGAVAEVERQIIDPKGGELIARATQVSILRGDGGFSTSNGKSDPAPELLPPVVADKAPDDVFEFTSLPQAALFYRLSGDMNPLHSDPDVARAAGYPRPILHGLCSYGTAAHAVLRLYCDYDAGRLKRLAARFSAPVFPGEQLRFEFWRLDGRFRFKARAVVRDTVVLDHGIAEIAA